MPATIYLLPVELSENIVQCIPTYVVEAIQQCSVFYVENLRSARRCLKRIWPALPIDDRAWHEIGKDEKALQQQWLKDIKNNAIIGIVSEAGCPGVADPGQQLVQWAQEQKAQVKPLVGPNSILLSLMASGMNGQIFQFVGYLPIEGAARKKRLQELEADSAKRNCTQIFIETPYRNNQLLQELLQTCRPNTRICIAVDITAPTESIQTQTVQQWKGSTTNLHKRPCIFLLHSSL
jgi:16S rRNA (cytidine1402-2'-O)-methyltransferase